MASLAETRSIGRAIKLVVSGLAVVLAVLPYDAECARDLLLAGGNEYVPRHKRMPAEGFSASADLGAGSQTYSRGTAPGRTLPSSRPAAMTEAAGGGETGCRFAVLVVPT